MARAGLTVLLLYHSTFISHDVAAYMTSSPEQPQPAAKEKYWQRRGGVACVLWPASLLFRGISAVRRWWLQRVWQPWKASVPVIVVGNLTAGGAGKTPTVIALVEHLKQAGWQPGVISRGYGRKDNTPCVEVHNSSTPAQTGDEPLLIKRSTGVPVFVGAKRVQVAQMLLEHYPATTVLLSDDGLQHYALGRDIEIAVFDDRGAGNGWLLPAGPLREPLSRARSVDLVLYNADAPSVDLPGYMVTRGLKGYLPLSTWADTCPAQRTWQPVAALVAKCQLQGTSVAAAAGIGHPQRFFNMLAQAGVKLEQTLPLPDHYDFAQSPFEAIRSDIILITEKDAAKCLQLPHQEKLHVVALDYEPERAFMQRLDQLLADVPNTGQP